MYTKFAPAVLRVAYAPLTDSGWSQIDFVSQIFADYYDEESVNATCASRIMHGKVPSKIVRFYADGQYRGCPRRLCERIEAVTDGYHVSSTRRWVYEALLGVMDLLPEDDRKELVPKDIELFPSENQLNKFLADLLWYAMCQDMAMPHLDIA